LDNQVVEFQFDDVTGLSKQEIRDVIAKIETVLMQGEPLEVPIIHHFSKDVYAREMQLPKDCLIVGKIHKHENLNILSSGEVSVLSVDGVKRVKAPYTFVASSGAKRVIYAHTDVTWTTIHGTSERDVEKIEEQFIVKSYDELPHLSEAIVIDFKEEKCLG
jgi:hypothetical protein